MIFWNTCHLDLESMSFVHSKFETWRVPGSIPMIVGRKNWWMAVDWDLLLSASWSSFLVIVHLSVHLLVRLLLHPCPTPFSPPSSPPCPLPCPLHCNGLESLAVSFLVIRNLIIFLGNNQAWSFAIGSGGGGQFTNWFPKLAPNELRLAPVTFSSCSSLEDNWRNLWSKVQFHRFVLLLPHHPPPTII